MHAHETVPPLPVDRKLHHIPNLWVPGLRRQLVGCGHMDDLVLRLARHRGGDGDAAAVAQRDRARIPRLAARGGVEDRPIEDDAAPLVDGNDRRLCLAQLGIVTKQRLRAMAHQSTCSNGTSISGFASIHSGTGNPLPRRNSGLNNLD